MTGPDDGRRSHRGLPAVDEDSLTSIGTVMFGVDGSLFVGSGDGSELHRAVDVRAPARAERQQPGRQGHAHRVRRPVSGLPDNPFFD